MIRTVLMTTCLLLLSGCETAAAPASSPTATALSEASPKPPEACTITQPPSVAFVPPAPYPAQLPPEYAGQFWYGTPELWTMLAADGTWAGLPQSAAGYGQKVFWWSKDYRRDAEPAPALTVTGRRLDAAAPTFMVTRATNASADFGTAMLTGVDIPTPGCWEITGHYRGHDLSFVVRVTP